MSWPRTQRIRVVQTVLDLEAGGLERVVADLARRLDPGRFDVHVLALKFLGRHAQGLEQNATLHVAPPLPPWTLVWPRPLTNTLRRIAPDVVHSHSGAWFKTARAAHAAGVPAMIHTEHGRPDPDPWHGRVLEHIASRTTDALIAVSDQLGKQMAPRIASGCRVEVILNGIDTDHFTPGRSAADWRERLGLHADVPVIGCVSRLDPIKDFPMLLEALAILRSTWDGPLPVLVIAGEGPERDHIRQLEARWQLAGAVHCIGWIAEPVEVYPLFEIFTLSSRSEGTSIALLEAMSSGVCPVVTAVGGNPAILGPDLSHLMVPSGDANALADRWRSVLKDPRMLATYRETARRRVVAQFSLGAMVSRHEALYTELARPA
jgi:glycosyltransferase involved in cell wall biosynthesis